VRLVLLDDPGLQDALGIQPSLDNNLVVRILRREHHADGGSRVARDHVRPAICLDITVGDDTIGL